MEIWSLQKEYFMNETALPARKHWVTRSRSFSLWSIINIALQENTFCTACRWQTRDSVVMYINKRSGEIFIISLILSKNFQSQGCGSGFLATRCGFGFGIKLLLYSRCSRCSHGSPPVQTYTSKCGILRFQNRSEAHNAADHKTTGDVIVTLPIFIRFIALVDHHLGNSWWTTTTFVNVRKHKHFQFLQASIHEPIM